MQKDFEAFIGQGEQAQGGHGGLPRRKLRVCGWEEGKERRRKCEKILVLMCARFKHGKDVCKNQAWKECV